MTTTPTKHLFGFWSGIFIGLALLSMLFVTPAMAQNGKKKAKGDTTEVKQEKGKKTDTTTTGKKKFSLKNTITGLFTKKDKVNETAPATAVAPEAGGSKSDAAKSKAEQAAIDPAQAQAILDQYAQGYQQSYQQGNYKEAVDYLLLYQQAQDSILALQMEADSARVATERAELQALAAQESEARQRVVSYGIGIGLFLVMGIAVALFFAFRNKKKYAEELKVYNTQLAKANKEINEQAEKLAYQHEHILESINYARRIQEAILPNVANIARAFPQSFVLYLPKDIVSGDFFWFRSLPDGSHLIAAVDCTGHGVPGAFMSVLGMSLLQQIITEDPNLPPNEILNRLNQGVIQSLRQTDVGVYQQDGMDITLLKMSPDMKKAEFAGAHNPLYLVRKGELEIYKADKAPIGGRRYVDHKFEITTIDLQKGDSLYLFSDGFADQFGGEQKRKFSYKKLRELLVEHIAKPMPTQQEIIKSTHLKWRGDLEQLDDILIIGVRV